MKIRKAALKDFKELKILHKEFFEEEFILDKNANPDWTKRVMPSGLGKTLRSKKSAYFVAENKDRLVGFIFGSVEKADAFYKNRERGHIMLLFVKKEYRKKGIGKKLIDETIKWFEKRKIKWIKIESYAWNKSARKMYNKLGFKDYVIEMRKLK